MCVIQYVSCIFISIYTYTAQRLYASLPPVIVIFLQSIKSPIIPFTLSMFFACIKAYLFYLHRGISVFSRSFNLPFYNTCKETVVSYQMLKTFLCDCLFSYNKILYFCTVSVHLIMVDGIKCPDEHVVCLVASDTPIQYSYSAHQSFKSQIPERQC